jgi:D-alanyl-lipoteichoic acid acyltransferase DltB (MBOAT superfamily)
MSVFGAWLGIICFGFQIYYDFSGYSDMAIGLGNMFGFSFKENFNYPYISRSMREFWRRWHMSLSGWFRDYLYIPLGGSRGSVGNKVRNILIIFIVSGFWHGANWTYITWGALNAVFFLPLLLLSKNRSYLGVVAEGRTLPNFTELIQMLTTFAITCLAWVFFRASSVEKALGIIGQFPNKTLFLLKRNHDSTTIFIAF